MRALAVILIGALGVVAGCRGDPATPADAAARAQPAQVAQPAQPKTTLTLSSSTASQLAPEHFGPAYHEATRAELEAAMKLLLVGVKTGASDPSNPWALAHGLLAFGPELKTTDGRWAIEVMVADYLEEGPLGLYRFPPRSAAGQPVEPHKHLLVKSLLEAKVPLSRKFRLKGGRTVTLEQLARDMEAAVETPTGDEDWHAFPWSLSALLMLRPPRPDALSSKPERKPPLETSMLARQTLDLLEIQQSFLTELMDQKRPDRVQKQKQLIYAHPCGGLHLVQAAMAGALYIKDPNALLRVRRQLDTVIFRWEAERAMYRKMVAQNPEYRLILQGQELKFYGHVLETLALAQRWKVIEADPRLTLAASRIAGDLVDAVNNLQGDYAKLEPIRRAREQTYLDLIGDGCHAIRGMRESLVAFFRPS